MDDLQRRAARALEGNLATQRDKLASQNKLFVRDRLDLLLDEGSFVEDGLLANALAPTDDLPADGVVTGIGTIEGRPVCVMANDPTVKAGSWGARTVEKIIRLTERALADELPVFWLVDSAGARITDQVELFPGRRGAGRIFANQVRLSGKVPQACCLFGPSAAGGAYIPSFCDIVVMVEGNASMYLGSPRMAEMVIGEVATLEEMGGARMHATVSGCGDNLAVDDAEAIAQVKRWFSYLPSTWRALPARVAAADPVRPLTADVVPAEERRAYDMHRVVEGLIWHAALVGEYLIEELARIPVEVEYASELRYRNPPIDYGHAAVRDHAKRRNGRHAGRAPRNEAQGPSDAGDLQRRRQHDRPGSRRRRLSARRAGDRRRLDQGVSRRKCAVLTMLALYFGRLRHLSFEAGMRIIERAAQTARHRCGRRSSATTRSASIAAKYCHAQQLPVPGPAVSISPRLWKGR